MPEKDLPIEASTKVAALLARYPELEDVLIGFAPPFEKLRHPLLRRSVAKVASLRQAAAVAGLGVTELVNALRAKVGQELLESRDAGDGASYFSDRPDWFEEAKVVDFVDDIEDPDPDTMPLVRVNLRAGQLQSGEILELVTTHLPAPGIDIMKKRGFLVWCTRPSPDRFRTFFRKP